MNKTQNQHNQTFPNTHLANKTLSTIQIAAQNSTKFPLVNKASSNMTSNLNGSSLFANTISRQLCRSPEKDMKETLCPDGYSCTDRCNCACECPQFFPSFCCPPKPSVNVPACNVPPVKRVFKGWGTNQYLFCKYQFFVLFFDCRSDFVLMYITLFCLFFISFFILFLSLFYLRFFLHRIIFKTIFY